ncbi:MAG: response regulator [Bacteroidales bacterium]|nr:response regulator [Bacteroidales bacterium]
MTEIEILKRKLDEARNRNIYLLKLAKACTVTINSKDMLFGFRYVHNFTKEFPDNGHMTMQEYTSILHSNDRSNFEGWIKANLNGANIPEIKVRQLVNGRLVPMGFVLYKRFEKEGVQYIQLFASKLLENEDNKDLVAFYRNILESRREDIFATDINGGVIFANKIFREHMGWDKESALSCNVFDTNPTIKSYGNRIDQTQGKTFVIKNPYTRFPKIAAYEYSIYSAINNKDEKEIWVFGHDITDQQEKEKSKDVELKQAHNASKMKSLFLANMSHEIRTPLNAINGFSKLLAYEEDEQTREHYLEIIESNSTRLMDLINDILDLSRVESGQMTFKIQPVNVSDMLHEVYNIQRFRCDGIKLIVDEGNTNLYINSDRSRLIQVLSNLVGNAIKHTDEGTIHVSYTEENNMLHFQVKDTGHGIPENMLEDIFKEYVMANNNVQGTGLGLPLCKNIVENLGGKIWAESIIDSGSTFHFTIPTTNVTVQPIVKNDDTEKEAFKSGQESGSNKQRIMVAEDNPSNRELMKALLHRKYEITWAEDGIQAVEKVETNKPELILMDLQMPNMGGLDATKIIHEVHPDLPIIACSAYAFPEDMKKAKEVGCVDFLSKPVRLAELNKMLEKYLNK